MPTELEELVEFLHHGNTNIRNIAAENLVGYSSSQPAIFKTDQLTPIKDLKLLVRDYPPIAKNAVTILVNLSADPEVLRALATDDAFVESVLTRLLDPDNAAATELSMLVANLSKHESLQRLLTTELPRPKALTSHSPAAIDLLLAAFLAGADGKYNKNCTFDYLAYAFAELAKFEQVRQYFATPRKDDDGQIPLSKIYVFTEHGSDVRRRGVAHALKNVCFETSAHPLLLADEDSGVLPYLLRPLMGGEEYADDEAEAMFDELQLLPADKQREKEPEILISHLDALLLLATTREGRDVMRSRKVYPIIRECHGAVENEEVREACDRLVQVIMRDEAPDEAPDDVPPDNEPPKVVEIEDEEEDIVDIL